jgi:hypothetical protein
VTIASGRGRTVFRCKRVPTELLVRAVAVLAEGMGRRAVARVFTVDTNTVRQWLVEVADQLQAISQYWLHDLHLSACEDHKHAAASPFQAL